MWSAPSESLRYPPRAADSRKERDGCHCRPALRIGWPQGRPPQRESAALSAPSGGIGSVVLEANSNLAPGCPPLLERGQHQPCVALRQCACRKDDQVATELLDAVDRERASVEEDGLLCALNVERIKMT